MLVAVLVNDPETFIREPAELAVLIAFALLKPVQEMTHPGKSKLQPAAMDITPTFKFALFLTEIETVSLSVRLLVEKLSTIFQLPLPEKVTPLVLLIFVSVNRMVFPVVVPLNIIAAGELKDMFFSIISDSAMFICAPAVISVRLQSKVTVKLFILIKLGIATVKGLDPEAASKTTSKVLLLGIMAGRLVGV